MWDLVRKSKVATIAAHDGVVTSMCVVDAPGGAAQLLTAGADRSVKLWASKRA